MRAWWVLLVATLVGLGAILLTAPKPDGGWKCQDSTAVILLSPNYTNDTSGRNPSAAQSACSEAAWARVPLGLGVAAVGGGLTGLAKRRHR